MENLDNWFRTPLGRLLAAQERELLARRLQPLYARRLLQIGSFGQADPLPLGEAVRQYVGVAPGTGGGDLVMEPEELPLLAGSVEAVVLVHALDFSCAPHGLLREAERVLAPEGHLLVLGFNPYSLWGLSRLWSRGEDLPRAEQHLSVRRLRDWMALLGLQFVSADRLLFRPPWQNDQIQAHLGALERYGPRVVPWLGGAYVAVAKKRVLGVRPAQPAWRAKPRLVPGLAQPTASVASRQRQCRS